MNKVLEAIERTLGHLTEGQSRLLNLIKLQEQRIENLEKKLKPIAEEMGLSEQCLSIFSIDKLT